MDEVSTKNLEETVKETVQLALKYLEDWLEFTPSLIETREIRGYVGPALAAPDSAYEAVICFLQANYGIKDKNDFSYRYQENRDKLIAEIKDKQSARNKL